MLRRSSRNTDIAPHALVEDLEGRKLLASIQLPIIGIKIAKRQDTDGTALNSNRITIAFSRTVRIGDASKFRNFGYANDLLNPSQQRKVTVGLTVTRDANDGRVLTIITDRLIRKGSTLQIPVGALNDGRGNDVVYDASTAATTIKFASGQNKPRFTMSNRNWRPTDLSYFTKDVYSAAPDPTVANSAPNATTVRNNLVAFMNAKVTAGKITQAQATNAIAIYDNSSVAAYFPSANLRAALVSLTGTVAEPAIQSYIGKSNVTSKSYTSVVFSDGSHPISNSAPIGETKLSENGRLSLVIRNTYAGEDFRALSAVLAHEALHQDTTADSQGTPPSTQDEEIIANAVGINVYVQQAQIDGTFIDNGTGLVNKLNEQLLALLNSGDKLFPYGGILRAPALNSDGNVFVGAKTNVGGFGDNSTVKSFENLIRREYVSRGFNAGGTNSNPTGVAILSNIVGSGQNLSLFGTNVQTLLDNSNTILTDATYIKMAELLKLTY